MNEKKVAIKNWLKLKTFMFYQYTITKAKKAIIFDKLYNRINYSLILFILVARTDWENQVVTKKFFKLSCLLPYLIFISSKGFCFFTFVWLSKYSWKLENSCKMTSLNSLIWYWIFSKYVSLISCFELVVFILEQFIYKKYYNKNSTSRAHI